MPDIESTIPNITNAIVQSRPLGARLMSSFPGPKLQMSKSNYKQWAEDIYNSLLLNSVEEHITRESSCPDQSDTNYHAWCHTDGVVTAFILSNVRADERDNLSLEKTACDNWEVLRERYENRVHARQMGHLLKASSIQCDEWTPIPDTAREIRESIRRVFAEGDVTEDLLTCVWVINALVDPKHYYIRSNIANGLAMSTKESPYTFDRLLSYLEMEQSILNNLETKTQKRVRFRRDEGQKE